MKWFMKLSITFFILGVVVLLFVLVVTPKASRTTPNATAPSSIPTESATTHPQGDARGR